MPNLTRRGFSGSAILSCVLARSAQALATEAWSGVPSDQALQSILAQRVNDLTLGQGGVGLVAGVLESRGRRTVAAGQNDKSDDRALTGDTVFEIGSIGKVFTALLLADMAVRREVSLEDPVARHLPTNTKLPERNDRPIRLLDLATHMSGLPFMPDLPKSDKPSAKAYSTADLYHFIADYQLTRDPGADWDYSNVGYWLLGEALANRAAKPFKELLRARVLDPLGLRDSGFVMTPRMKANLAIGHDASLRATTSWLTVPVYNLMPAAGVGFYATADDLLTFVTQAMGLQPSPLGVAFALTVATQVIIPRSSNVQALGWTLLREGKEELVFRDGGTFGFASCIAWRKDRRAGAVVLANSVGDVGDIGRHILAPGFPLVRPQVSVHREIALDVGVLRRYAGSYVAPREGTFTIALSGDHLTFEAPADWGLPKLRIRPETNDSFFANELPLRAEFKGPNMMIIHPPRGQKAIVALRK